MPEPSQHEEDAHREEERDARGSEDVAYRNASRSDDVDVTSMDSFPASDPPSWTPVTGIGHSTRHTARD